MELFKTSLVKYLINYFRVNHLGFIFTSMKYGRYNLVTYDDKNTPIISTIFYIDGDVLNNLFEVDGKLLAENHEKLVRAHIEKVKAKVSAMDLLYTQIAALITLCFSAFTFFQAYSEFGLVVGTISSAAVGSLVLLFRKSLAKIIFFLLRILLKIYLKAFYSQLIKG